MQKGYHAFQNAVEDALIMDVVIVMIVAFAKQVI